MSPDNSAPPTPPWVKIFATILAVLVAAFIVLHLSGGGFRNHGP